MKSLIKFSLLFVMIGMLASCKSDGKKSTAGSAATPAAGSGETFKVVPGTKMNWIGHKLASNHRGTINVSGGDIKVANNTITGGNFTIDMSSIVCTDLDEKSGKGKLEGHLKNSDFFDVEKFPTAKFEITKVVSVKNNPTITHNIFGNLTLKDITKNVGFNANVNTANGQLTVKVPNFKINRTDFGIKYGSGKFTDVVKDRMILDEMELGIPTLIARK